jgi:hypothetical protein
LALKSDGTVLSWYSTSSGKVVSNVLAGLEHVVAIAEGSSMGGASQSMALRDDGTVVMWGDNSYGQQNVPSSVTNVVAIASGDYHALALRSDGTVIAWGRNDYGQTKVPNGLTNVMAVAAGYGNSVALKTDGSIVVWGDNSYGQQFLPSGLSNIVGIASGDYHCLALVAHARGFATAMAGPTNQDYVVTAPCIDLNSHLLTYYVRTLPQAGSLYQYASGARGVPITATNTVVTDPLGRLIFVPADGEVGVPYASFTIVASDGTYSSSPATVTINVVPSPTIGNTSLAPGANGPFAVSFSGLSNVTYSVWVSTNLTDWSCLGNASQPSPANFEFSDPQWTNYPGRFYQVRFP